MILITSILYGLLPNCLVFYSGGSNIITHSIYTNFLNNFRSTKIYRVPNGNSPSEVHEMFTELNNKYNIISMGHSSGCVKAINNCNPAISKLILLDPVKTPFLNKKKDLNYLDDILIINAEKSYKWSRIPPFIPFIPAFRLKKSDLSIEPSKIKEITIKNYGHCDIINNPYRNLMHYSRISVGHSSRNSEDIYKYHRLLYKYIMDFIEENPKSLQMGDREQNILDVEDIIDKIDI